ncbi:histidine phosphotransferase [Mycena metata]|uniref:Histidine phosphotransferase n=1 Tax=Mycena metata TaxID=1033252 RepID=A0AAD7H877_9AGAR|nr:histidine phosphotransferase [Mycena metata]
MLILRARPRLQLIPSPSPTPLQSLRHATVVISSDFAELTIIWHRQAIDMDIFSQILELDEDGTYDFSKEMVAAYFSQATTTFSDMDKAMADKKLPELSALGHFLKGSSAALGISKVQAACEKMQHYGELRDEAADKDLKADEALSKISALLVEVKAEYADAETWLKKWYEDKNESFDEVKP